MVLGIDWGIGGCLLDMGKTIGRVSSLETDENDEFSKSVIFFWTFLEAQNRLIDGPKDKLGHWGMSFGHGEHDGKGPRT